MYALTPLLNRFVFFVSALIGSAPLFCDPVHATTVPSSDFQMTLEHAWRIDSVTVYEGHVTPITEYTMQRDYSSDLEWAVFASASKMDRELADRLGFTKIVNPGMVRIDSTKKTIGSHQTVTTTYKLPDYSPVYYERHYRVYSSKGYILFSLTMRDSIDTQGHQDMIKGIENLVFGPAAAIIAAGPQVAPRHALRNGLLTFPEGHGVQSLRVFGADGSRKTEVRRVDGNSWKVPEGAGPWYYQVVTGKGLISWRE